jgi:hypothetical protein
MTCSIHFLTTCRGTVNTGQEYSRTPDFMENEPCSTLEKNLMDPYMDGLIGMTQGGRRVDPEQIDLVTRDIELTEFQKLTRTGRTLSISCLY